jgi:4-hydroxy-3-polyprenylbenzoate decarboxylase
VDLEVPANAEIVLEGYIDPAEMRLEGPFGDHTGYYSQDGDYPIFHITAITHRKNPVYLTTIVGKPPQEDFYLGRATERIFLPLLRTQLPEIVDMDMPVEGIFHNCVIVSLDKRYPMQSRRLMSALWGLGQMSFVKTIVTVDAEVNVHDYKEVAKLLLNKVDFTTDLFFSEGVLDVLNHASDQRLHGSKLGIDLSTKIEGEPGYKKEAPVSANSSELPSAEKVMAIFKEVQNCKVLELQAKRSVLLVALNKTGPHQGKQFIQSFLDHAEFSAIEIIIVLEGHVDIENISTVMWKFFNNLDPKRDFYFDAGRLGIDVTQKFPEEGYQQSWPEEIEMTAEIKTQVDKKWHDLFNK